MTENEDKIHKIIDALKQGTSEVRRNPTEANYQKWEARILEAGRDTTWMRIFLISLAMVCGVIVLIGITRTFFGSSEPKPPAFSECVLYNDVKSVATVNIRSRCDINSCGYERSTIVGQYPNNTPVRINENSAIGRASGRFTWIQVVIINTGEIAWVASSKVRCR